MGILNWLIAPDLKRIAKAAPFFAESVKASHLRATDLVDFESEALILMALTGLSFAECDILFDQWWSQHSELDWRSAMRLLKERAIAGNVPTIATDWCSVYAKGLPKWH